MADAAWSLSEERRSDRLANSRVARVSAERRSGEFDEPSVNGKPVKRLLHQGMSVAAFGGDAGSASSRMGVRCRRDGEQMVGVEAGPVRAAIPTGAPAGVVAGVIDLKPGRDRANPQLVREPMSLTVSPLEPQRSVAAGPSLRPGPAQRLGVDFDPCEQPFCQRSELTVNDQRIAVAPPFLVMSEAPSPRFGLLSATRDRARAFIDLGLSRAQCPLLSLLLVVRGAQTFSQWKARAVGERAELRGFHTQRLA